ncbi:HAD-IIA family hydrolase [Rhizobium panacihumi]|uniref:HAD-IIA family hydrolase n=1 Tax=Rhizobium panacihumi TaxID=2008450 RepID=UPI003D7A7F40
MHQFNDMDGVLFDLDGTLVSDGKALPWARELVDASKGNFVIVTNDAEHTNHEISRMMQQVGLAVDADRIVMAGMEAIRLVAEEMPGAKVALAASSSLQTYAQSLGLHLSDSDPDVVLIGRDRNFSYDTIRMASNAVLAGAQLVVCNPDLTHPGSRGTIVPETGALAASILACTGPVAYRIVGKPEPGIFLAGMRLLGSDPSRTLMVGDNPNTDGMGAARVGMHFFQVGV